MQRFLKLFSIVIATAIPQLAFAATETSDVFNVRFTTLLVLGGLLAILILANALLAQALLHIIRAYHQKTSAERNSKSGVTAVLIFLACALLPNISQAQEAAVEASSLPAAINGIPATQFYILIGLVGFLMVSLLFLTLQVRAFSHLMRSGEEKPILSISWTKINFLLNKSVEVKDEEHIVLEHDYDGIRELDNDLPPWWKWGFVLTIVASVIYVGYYHFGDGPSQKEEYNMAVAEAEIQKAAFLAKVGAQVDENNVTLIEDASTLADAKTLFNNTCAACHRPDGGGAVGPNLTDEYWLHGGSLPEVFKSIKYGWRDKGMPPWDGNLSAKQIAGIASFVMKLRGSNPSGAKAPQGTAYEEKVSAAASAETAIHEEAKSESASKL